MLTRKYLPAPLITTVRDLDGIEKNNLAQLYEEGKASIICVVNDPANFIMTYRIIDGRLVAEDELSESHPVMKELKQPVDFINYTKKYYGSEYGFNN